MGKSVGETGASSSADDSSDKTLSDFVDFLLLRFALAFARFRLVFSSSELGSLLNELEDELKSLSSLDIGTFLLFFLLALTLRAFR
jgi:hypothetical protein